MPLRDYKGCLHVHSTDSDGDRSIPHIIAAARDAGLDFIVLTDHVPLPLNPQRPDGWQDGVLVAVGLELRAAGEHCVVLGPEPAQLARHTNVLDHDEAIDRLQQIRAGGALVFVAHPRTVRKRLFHLGPPGWTDWDLDIYDGIEIWPYMHDWIRDLKLRNFLSHVREPDRWITGPEPDVLRHWDQAGARRRCVAVGALDNHARRIPFRRWGPALLEIFPHRQCFQTVRTHVLAPQPFTGDAAADLPALYALLAQGRSYVSYDLLADATGFTFAAERQGRPILMGDEAPAGSPLDFRARCPVDAALTLLRDGQPIARATGRELAARADQPGVYRIEARLDNRPWLFSNPIYLRPPKAH